MLLNRCPVCHAHITLDAMTADAAAREVLLLFAALHDELAHALLGYISLWRPAKRDLSYARTLKIATDTLALEPTRSDALVQALSETVHTLRAKAAGGAGTLPISSHGYLKQVLKSTVAVCEIVQTSNLPAINATETGEPRLRARRSASAMGAAVQGVGNAVARYAD